MDNFQVPIYNYIRRLVVSHEDAEDVLQEVFIRVYRNLDQFRGESSLSTWIYRIATNESLRLLNTRKDEEAIPAEEVQEELIGKLKASITIDYENETGGQVSGSHTEFARKTTANIQPYAITMSSIMKKSAVYWIVRSILSK